MFKGQKSFRSIVIAATLIVATTITASASWLDYINPISYFTTAESAALAVAGAPAMVIGTCDTAGPIEVESTLPSGPTAYATLSAAFVAINAGTHQGAINIEVCANSTETAATVLNSSGAGSANYTSISIRPLVDGVTISGPTVTGRGLIELNGADNVTIDGDNPNTAGTNRNLTITNTAAATVTYSSVIRLAHSTLITSNNNNTIRNLILNGSATGRNAAANTSTSGSENTTYGILAGGGASTSAATTAPSAVTSVSNAGSQIPSGQTTTNLVVDNNAINACARGIALHGAAATVATGLQITGNSIGSSTLGATTNVYSMGITVQGSSNGIIRQNTINNVESYLSTSLRGIDIGSISGVAGDVFTIDRNIVSNVVSRSTTGYGAFGLNVTAGTGHVIQNNFLFGNNAVQNNTAYSTSFAVTGIRVAGGTNHKIYHNSVNLSGAMLGSTAAEPSNCLSITATSVTGVDVRNNVFVNTQTGLATSVIAAVQLPSAATSAMNLTLNNNDYYNGATPTANQYILSTVTSSAVTTNYTAANFNAGATSPASNSRAFTSTVSVAGTNDNSSKVVDPVFVSSTDLHIQSSSTMESAGANAGVTTDIDGDSRGGTPDIGADEITVAGPGTVQFSATSYTSAEGNNVTITVNRTGGSSGAISVDYAAGGGTATGGASCTTGVDYITPTPGTLNWADTDAVAKTFNVQLCADNDVETESLNLTLSNPIGTTITGTNPVPLNITDNAPGTIQFSSTTYAGDEGLVAVVTATRTSGTGGAVSVNYATSDGTATNGVCGSGGDYVAASGTLNWTNGESTSKTFNVTLCSDLLTSEGAETVNLTLSSPTGGATIGASNPAVLTINDAGIVFCNSDGITIPLTSGTGPFPSTPYPSVVAVSGLVGTTNTVKVKLNTITHTWGPDIDILLVSPSGQKFVLMSDVGDSAGLDTAVNLTFVDGGTTIPASGAIASGSYAPRDLEASDVFATGAPAGPYSSPATVGAATLNGTFGGLNPNGNWSLYVSDDTGGDGGSIASWCLEFTLNPPTPGTVQFSPAAYTPNENTVQTITATRTGGTAGAVSVDYATGGGTATSGTCGTNDYVAATGALNWADGESGAKTFNVTICPDAVLDPGETFEATLSNPTGGVTIGGTNPAVVTITDVPPPFSGTYTVGSGGNYPSLTNTGGIFEAINLSGATGNVTIQIISNLTGELGTHALNEIAGGFSTLIYPCGNPISITGSNTGALIRLNGADNVTIFGDSVLCNPPLVGGEPARRHLTIQNTNTGLATSVILIASNGANGAQNNLIQHVNVLGQDPTTTLYGISLGGATPGSVATGPNNDNKVINNSIKRAHIGVYSAGQVATPNTGTEIRENETSAVTGDRIRRVGIVVRNDNGAQILDNSINGINNTGESFDAIGIGVGTEDVNTTATTSGNVSNALVARNRVNGVSNDTTFSAAGIAVAGGTLGANTIVNNMVSGIISDATTPDIPTGIWVAGVTGSNTILYHNSVSMTGDRSALTTPGTSQLPSYGIAITGVDPTVEMKNNIFYTTQTAEAVANPGALSYAIGMVSTTFTNLDSDSNDFWSAGPRDGGFRTGSLASAAGTSHVDLSAWQVAITNDATSQEADPVFINPANDLHLDALTTPLLGDGQGGETFDHDGDPRPAANTDVGADEVVQSVGGSFPAGTYYNGATADGDVLSGNVTFTNALTLNGILTTIVPDPPNSDIVYVVTLGCGVTSVGNASTSNYIVGSVNKQYCGPANFTYPVGSGGFYSPANVDVTAVGVNPSSLTVRPHDALLVGFNPLETLTRNWQLDEVGDITANLLFYYDESDVVGNESDYRIWRRESNGTDTNMCSGGPCVDTVNNILGPVNGVTTFSRWTGSGPLAPTSSAASVSGRVVTANGQGIRGAAIVITGNSLPTPIIVKTGSLGYFQADNLDTGQTYVVTVVSKRFTFSQPSRVINLADNINDVDFMANPLE